MLNGSIDELGFNPYCVIVYIDGKRGLLLPDLEGINDPEDKTKGECAAHGSVIF